MAAETSPSPALRLLVVSARTHTAEVQEVPWRLDGDGANLETLTNLVGGYLEAIALSEEAHVYLNENGKFEGLPVNHLATRLMRAAGAGLAPDDFIVGTAVVVGSLTPQGLRDGNEHDVPASVLDLCERSGVPVTRLDA